MTVGISLTNGLEAVVITDARVSMNSIGISRQSDAVNKTGQFKRDQYHGVVFGTGEGQDVVRVIKHLPKLENLDTFDNFFSSLYGFYKKLKDEEKKRWIDFHKNEFVGNAVLYDDEDVKKRYIHENIGKMLEAYDRRDQTYFLMVGYDKEAKKIRKIQFSNSGYVERSADHYEIGSGFDGANMYFTTKLQGIDVTKLNTEALMFFAANAYAFSTLNQGVGGTPSVTSISTDGLHPLSQEQTCALMNISGAYLSEGIEALTMKTTRKAVKDVIGEKPDYKILAKILGINKQTLTGIYIPYSSWQERANRKLFGNGK